MLEKAIANGAVVKATQSVLYAQVSFVNTADSTNSQTSKNLELFWNDQMLMINFLWIDQSSEPTVKCSKTVAGN